ncbi:glycosyltransferase family 4 protein [Lacrimispora saccharolytica]|uniref:glycosyltransferase family 4 protein n=1 Tax=Lacrimispora saccharolytica TaxID=84030 RepID=UPI00265CB896|nr:glycosyltransferase family 1 protein [Lacrimispora saccharolytica]MCF2657189.1 glycosyltransferase family 4 protein [Lacrimispora saccharolytica]
MKIGIDISLLAGSWDGIGHYIHNVLVYMNKQNNEDVFYLYSDKPITKELGLNSNFVIRDGDGRGNHVLWLLTKLPKIMKDDRLDVFWQPDFLLPISPKTVKTVVTVHDMSAYAYSEYAPTRTNITHKLFLKPTCKKADVILTISQNCKQELMKYMSVDERKITTIYNGCKMFPNGMNATDDEVNAYLQKLGVEKKQFLLFVGTLSPRKNADVLVKAFLEYKRLGGKKKLVLAGNIADKSQNVRDIINQSVFKDSVVIAGYISDLEKRALYYNAAMLLYPSRLEGFGFPMLEAMQAQIPVITSNCSCMPEIAQKGAVYLNNIDSYEELCAHIFEVESMNHEQMKQLLNIGMERVEFFEGINFQKLTYDCIRNVL